MIPFNRHSFAAICALLLASGCGLATSLQLLRGDSTTASPVAASGQEVQSLPASRSASIGSPRHRRPVGEMARGPLAKLGLTASQRQQISAIVRAYRAQSPPGMASHWNQAKAILLAPVIDPATVWAFVHSRQADRAAQCSKRVG
ncbi:MAG: hypothetical protein KGR26_04470, partial [Cyanobacteria bacterium REEB65]|nr:hypothetical protein [Cyanobacteria bacterium REEB65]